jgi:hypothetical protein
VKERVDEWTKAGGFPAYGRFCAALPVRARSHFVLTAVFGFTEGPSSHENGRTHE